MNTRLWPYEDRRAKTLGETRLSHSFLLWPTNEQRMIMNDSGSVTGQRSDSEDFIQFHLLEDHIHRVEHQSSSIYQYLLIKVTSFRVGCKVMCQHVTWIAHHVINIFILSDSGDVRLIFGKDSLEDHLTLEFYKIQHLFVLCEGNTRWIRYDVFTCSTPLRQ